MVHLATLDAVDASTLVDIVPSALGVCQGPDHHFTYGNTRLRTHARDFQVTGMRFRDAFPDLVDGPVHEALDRAFGAGETVLLDAPTRGVVQPVVDAGGKVEGVMLYLATEASHDELERRALELDRREAAVAARERARDDKDRLLGELSHALRTPLHVLMGYGSLLRAAIAPFGSPRVEAVLMKLLGAAEVMAGVVDEMLDLQAIAAGTFTLQPRLVPFGTLMGAAIARLQEQALAGGQRIRADIPEGLPLIYADERRVGTMLAALVDQALAATPSGGTITFCVRADDEAVTCEIADEGQDERAPTWPLGRDYAHAHSGSLWRERRPGVGTVHRLRLPLQGPADELAS